MRKACTVVFGAVLLVMACMPQHQSVQMQTQFDYDLHRPYTGIGNNSINGQAFLRQQDGGVVTCAGSRVALIPATAFFREIITHAKAGKKPQVEIDPAYKTMIKQSQCDAQGNFTFSNLPDGNWLVVTVVKWFVGNSSEGGNFLKEVHVANGETIRVLLTEDDCDFSGR